ncbi:MAG: hypothetical protein A2288_00405 [Candidatus Moranbacteria bacterium RIFOXYA12_FULL_44_15]|nr:MAG: hypothetical protein A2288_00405 [Candidatus Moranbacteria bacterium RIFOXYA12_FULL_44_15]OGI35254.1 MAG: hypothetical protein A2259_03040 [Candidatus Moranbacteria bacterium RIFOXYA2_FULL_43_15]
MNNQTQLQQTLIDELGLSTLPPEKQEELLVKMTEVVLKRIFVETMEKLSEADQEEYSKMIDANAAPEEVEKFLTEKIANYDEMVKKVVEDFKNSLKQSE